MIDGSVVSVLVVVGGLAAVAAIVVMVRAAYQPSRDLGLDPEPVPIDHLRVPVFDEPRSDTAPTRLVATPPPTTLGGRLAQVAACEQSAEPIDAVVDLRVPVTRPMHPYEPDPDLMAHLDDLLADACFVHYAQLRPSCAKRVVDTRHPVGNDRVNDV